LETGLEQSQSIAPDKGFFELGADSLAAVELRNSLQSSLGRSLPVTLVFDHPSINALVEFLAKGVLKEIISAETTTRPPE